jgi:peptidyl-prolyl cis-trans isomerase B (cyclophilin B)
MKRILFCMLVIVFTTTAFSSAADSPPRVRLTTTQGDIVVQLDPAAAPETVANFLAYVRDGFYNGTIFHRVIAGFMIQGGGYDRDMQPRATRPPITNEAANGLRNRTGTIAMARTADPHSASAQFFINVKDNAFLDHRSKTDQGWGYCVFGHVVDGMAVVRAIETVPTTARSGMRDVPAEPVVIQAATVVSAP